MSLELIANKDYDRKTSEVCKEIAENGVLAEKNCKLQYDKAAALIDILEIGNESSLNCESFVSQKVLQSPLTIN